MDVNPEEIPHLETGVGHIVEHPQHVYEQRLSIRENMLRRMREVNAPAVLVNKQLEMVDRAQREVNGERFPEPKDAYDELTPEGKQEVDDLLAHLDDDEKDLYDKLLN